MSEKNVIKSLLENKNNNRKGLTVIKSDSIEEFIPYAQIYSNACKYLKIFQKNGVKTGNEVLFQVDDIDKFIYIFWACQLGGITAVPIDIGDNEEDNVKIFRIWNVLYKPYFVCEKKHLENIELFENEGFTNEIADMKMHYIDSDITECTDKMECLFHDFENEDYIALIQFSSGSTGIPKGIPIKYSALYTHVNALAKREEVTEKDVTLNWAPLSHNLGLVSVHLVSTLMGISQYVMPKKIFVNNPLIWMDKTDEYRVTMIYSPNFGFKHFLNVYAKSEKKKWDLSCVRIIFNGAEPINYDLCQSFLNALKKYKLHSNVMYTAYGCSESTSVITIPNVGEPLKGYMVERKSLIYGEKVVVKDSNDDKDTIVLVGVGHPVDDCEVRVCDSDNSILDDFYVGELQVRGKNVIDNYYNNEKATKEAFLENGWFKTGDLCFKDKENYVITGRAKEIIFFGGQNYYPYDIERVVEREYKELSGKVAACGVFSEKLQTDEIYFFLEYNMNDGIEHLKEIADQIKYCVRTKVGLYVGKVIPVEHLEKTDSGKMQRLKMQQNYETGQYQQVLEVLETNELQKTKEDTAIEFNLRDEVKNNLLSIWREVLASNEIGVDDNFFELGGSSNLLITLIAKIDSLYKECISIVDIFEAPTINLITDIIMLELCKQRGLSKYLMNIFPKEMCKMNMAKETNFYSKQIDLSKYQQINSQINSKIIYIASYTQLLHNIIDNNTIGINLINTVEHQGKVFEINMENITTFEQLIQVIETNRANESSISLDKLYVKRKSTDEVLSVFSIGEANVSENFNEYDILVEIYENKLNIKVNQERLELNHIKKMIDQAEQLLLTVDKNINV